MRFPFLHFVIVAIHVSFVDGSSSVYPTHHHHEETEAHEPMHQQREIQQRRRLRQQDSAEEEAALKERAIAACAHVTGDPKMHKSCVFDVMATGDETVAMIYGTW
jgi:hypothetical protein